MKYLVFSTSEEAIQAEADISALLNLPRVGLNAETNEEAYSCQMTTCWAIPKQIKDGRWVIPSLNETGIEAESDWFINWEQP